MDDATRTAALERLEPLVGEWAVEARFTLTPEPIRGTLTFAWELGRKFLQQRSTTSHPAAPGVLALLSVPEEGDGHEYVQHYFDSRGVVRVYRMTLRDGEWTLLRDRPDFTPLDFAQRYTGTFGDAGRTITGRWEKSHDGGATWEHDFDLAYRKLT
ncbi:hypothetical protein GCM10010472_08960 [Pseudonocardia halophobica]|uniref:DUF1579 domain-containing protein n=1 Tax=Pseudonocardia halophobica TaxID=29401 RepID=A0A9W6L661_9PSEU|nr:hypothetical protein [Pseudonocardia halophobica]GLL12964.1 hypothetical protein GCM10017577_41070 [Pseudonocardia halophobica]